MFDGKVIHARHVIMGQGRLHYPSVPDFKGLHDLDRPHFHTARWDHAVDLAGKRVVVIGSAASAIQVVPELAKTVAHLSVFQRTLNYIAPRDDRLLFRQERTVEVQLKMRAFILMVLSDFDRTGSNHKRNISLFLARG